MSEPDCEAWDPDSWTAPSYVEMPAKVKDLQTIDGVLYAVLEGGATVDLSPMFDPAATGTSQ